MTDKTQNDTPFSRLSRMGFSLFKSQPTSPRNRDSGKAVDDDENWYIPYNGPYEAPRRQPRQEKDRDSWGDPVDGEDDVVDILGDPELRNRYGGHGEEEERKARSRARAQSAASGRTVSSGAIDPSRNNTATPRRSTVSQTSRPVVPSFVDLDTAGGVGESPIPTGRYSKDSNSAKRKNSFTSLFTFNTVKRTTSSTKGLISSPTSPSSGSSEVQGRHGQLYPPPSMRRLPSDPVAAEQTLRSSGPDEQDYYNSYYSTLIRVPSEQDFDSNNDGKPSQLRSSASETSSALHPYAYRITTPPTPPQPPHSAPIFPSSTARAANGSTQISPPPMQMRHSPHVMLHPPTNHPLKNSVSTPNLRQRSKPLLAKGKDKWLSPETWCDAILFPRPRFRVKQDSDSISTGAGSGRIVSPPGSPVVNQFSSGPGITSIASRVLAHSRSMVDLQEPSPSISGPSTLPAPAALVNDKNRVPGQIKATESRPPRPKSWALDDLVLPSPVPSLAHVLEEGQILEHQRKKWQDQAIKSFQNERARSLSRARTKSLTSKQAKRTDHNSPFDFLAARGLLGNQDVIPVVQKKPRSRNNSQSHTDSRGTVGRSSHTHTTSLSKSVSKSSKTHSRNHSRSESLGRSAVKMARSTVRSTAAICGVDGAGTSYSVEDAGGLDGALQSNGTRVIRLADPALMPIESVSTGSHGASPAPSGQTQISDSMVGIAISTPPPQEEIHLHSHPYAQGGLSFYNRANDNPVEHSVGPHPSSRLAVPGATSRLQPSTQPISHPYAAYDRSARDREGSPNSFLADVRSDSQVPPAEKMWAQWSPGLLREVLPDELRQYSPYMSGNNSPVHVTHVVKRVDKRQMRNSSPIFDTIGVAETLVSAMERYSRDSGLGTSEEQEVLVEAEPIPGVQGSPSELGISSRQRPHRAAVQYDASRPLYIQKHNPAAPRSPPPLFHSPERLKTARNDSTESKDSSGSSASPSSPLGNVDDLENYRDLFYRPSMTRNDSNISTTARIPWDVNSSGHRVGSGLTSIARQLTEELEETHGSGASLQHSLSLSSRSSLSALRQSAYTQSVYSTRSIRSPGTEAGLHFVFSNIPETASQTESTTVRKVVGDAGIAFKPTVQIPEDIELSRASSPTRSPLDNDELDLFRLGQVNSLATPPVESSLNRNSYTGEMVFANDGEQVLLEKPEPHSPITPLTGVQTVTSHSSLQPPLPSADPTRSSYLTTSDASRISNLSDFPAPPPQHLTPAHMSLLSSYFDETLTPSEFEEIKTTKQIKSGTRSRSGSVLTGTSRPGPESRTEPHAPVSDQNKRSTFGGDEEIDDLLASLSPSPRRL